MIFHVGSQVDSSFVVLSIHASAALIDSAIRDESNLNHQLNCRLWRSRSLSFAQIVEHYHDIPEQGMYPDQAC